ncbi:MAG: hypothetical protein WBO93_12080 [Gammaproteobacteria bacterium]
MIATSGRQLRLAHHQGIRAPGLTLLMHFHGIKRLTLASNRYIMSGVGIYWRNRREHTMIQPLTRYYTLILLLLALPATVFCDQKPPAPAGFSWHVANNGVGTFLKPDNWHVLEQTKGNTNALFITRENIEKQAKFVIGFTVNQISAYSSNSSIKASQYAKLYIQKTINQHEVISSGVVKDGVTDMNVARVIEDKAGVRTMTHHIAIGMDDRDELYLVSFEAPESEWAAYDAIAGQMFNYFILGS